MAGTLEYEQLNKNLEMVDGHGCEGAGDYQTRRSCTRRLWRG